MSHEVTQYGFKWGGAQVTRIAEGPKGTTVIGIGAAGDPDWKHAIEVYVSRTGKSVRVFRKGVELKQERAS